MKKFVICVLALALAGCFSEDSSPVAVTDEPQFPPNPPSNGGAIVCPELHWEASKNGGGVDTLGVIVFVEGFYGELDAIGVDLLFDRDQLKWEYAYGLDTAGWTASGGNSLADTARCGAFTTGDPIDLDGERADLWYIKFSRVDGWFPDVKQFRCFDDLGGVTADCAWAGFPKAPAMPGEESCGEQGDVWFEKDGSTYELYVWTKNPVPSGTAFQIDLDIPSAYSVTDTWTSTDLTGWQLACNGYTSGTYGNALVCLGAAFQASPMAVNTVYHLGGFTLSGSFYKPTLIALNDNIESYDFCDR